MFVIEYVNISKYDVMHVIYDWVIYIQPIYLMCNTVYFIDLYIDFYFILS